MQTLYEKFKHDPLWTTIDAALSDLVTNGDLMERTGRDYIVGYIAMKIRSTHSHDVEIESRSA
jgi:hypothetical protein